MKRYHFEGARSGCAPACPRACNGLFRFFLKKCVKKQKDKKNLSKYLRPCNSLRRHRPCPGILRLKLRRSREKTENDNNSKRHCI